MVPDWLNWLFYLAGSSKSHHDISISCIFLQSPKYISYIVQIFCKQCCFHSNHFWKTYNKAKCYEKSQIFDLWWIGKKLFWKVVTLENQHLPQIGRLFAIPSSSIHEKRSGFLKRPQNLKQSPTWFDFYFLTEPRWALQPQGTQWFPRIGLFVVQAISLGDCRRPIEFLTL